MEKTARKYCWLLIAACFLVYTSTICIKMVYSSEIVEIINNLGESKARIGLGLTAYYVIYAISQVVLAPFVKKINMGMLMVVSLALSSILYALIPFTTELYQLWVILGINGVLHASTYGGCMYFFGKYLPPEFNAPACSVLSFGFIGGTVVSYVVAPAFIARGWWKWTFLLFALILMISVVVFLLVEKRLEKVFKGFNIGEKTTKQDVNETLVQTESKAIQKRIVFAMICLTTLAMVLIHNAYYIVSNWFPVYLAEVFNMSSSYSVFISVTLYVGAFICTNLGIIFCSKFKCKISNVARVLCVSALVVSAVQAVFYKSNLLLVVVISTLLISFTRATGTLIVSYLPLKAKQYINAATVAMVFNAAACSGAAFGPTFAGSIIDNYGWSVYNVFMCGLYAVSFACILLCTHFVKKLNI